MGVFTALVHQRPIPLGPDPAVPSGNPRFPVAAERDIRLRPGCARPPKLGPSGIRGGKYAIRCWCSARLSNKRNPCRPGGWPRRPTGLALRFHRHCSVGRSRRAPIRGRVVPRMLSRVASPRADRGLTVWLDCRPVWLVRRGVTCACGSLAIFPVRASALAPALFFRWLRGRVRRPGRWFPWRLGSLVPVAVGTAAVKRKAFALFAPARALRGAAVPARRALRGAVIAEDGALRQRIPSQGRPRVHTSVECGWIPGIILGWHRGREGRRRCLGAGLAARATPRGVGDRGAAPEAAPRNSQPAFGWGVVTPASL